MVGHATLNRCSPSGHAQLTMASVEISRNIPTALQIHRLLCGCHQHFEAHSESRGGARGQGGKRACPQVQLAHSLSVVLITLILFPICIIENHHHALAPVSGHSCLHLMVVYAEQAGLVPVPTGMAPWGLHHGPFCPGVCIWKVRTGGGTKGLGWRGLHAWLSRAVPRPWTSLRSSS